MKEKQKLERARDTIEKMIRIYCSGHHSVAPCMECERLISYAQQRLDACPFGESKPVCGRCHENCFEPAERDRMQAVMRYAGMRMLAHHPILATRHMLDALRARKQS